MSSSSINYQNDIIYYNVSQINSSSDTSIIAQYSENRQTPILNIPEDYYMSVIRFDIDATDIPIFLWPNDTDGSPNNEYYSIGLYNGTNAYVQPLTFIQSTANVINSFNAIYSYQTFCDILNNAFRALRVQAGSPFASMPFMTFDYTTGQYTFIVSKEYSDAGYTFYFNRPLFYKFVNFQATRNGIPAIFQTFDYYQIIVSNRTFNILLGVQDPNNVIITTAYQMKQEYQNLYNLSSLSKIFITSTKIPGNFEYISTNFGTGSNSNSMKIISDYVAPNDAFIGANRSVFTYYPTAEYRLVDLNGKEPLLSTDFQLFWEDELNNSYPIFLPPGGSFSIKLMFRKKTLAYKIHRDSESNKLVKKK
jgi:hypothetical protein